MIVDPGSKLLICHRRLYGDDQPRFFAGVVSAVDGGMAKVTGYSWTRDPVHGFERKRDQRTKIIPLVSGMLLVYELPGEISVETLKFEQPAGRTLILTDGGKFQMDLTERPVHGVA